MKTRNMVRNVFVYGVVGLCLAIGILFLVGTLCIAAQCGLNPWATWVTKIETTVVLPAGTEKVEHLTLLDDSINCIYDKTCSSRYVTVIVNGVWHTIVLDGTSFGELKNKLVKLTGTADSPYEYPYWEASRHQKYYVYFGEKTVIYSDVGVRIWEGSSLN